MRESADYKCWELSNTTKISDSFGNIFCKNDVVQSLYEDQAKVQKYFRLSSLLSNKFCLHFSLTENLTCFTRTLLKKYKQSVRSFFKTFSVCSLHFSGGQIMKIEIFYEVFSNSRDSSQTYWIVNVDWGLVKSKTVAVYLYWKTWKLKIWR